MINLISFVKLFPEYQKMQIVAASRTEALTARVLADHAQEYVRSVTVSGDMLIVVTTPEAPVSLMPPVKII